jgi:uncharacterized protein
MVTFILLIVGGLNWLAVGLFGWSIANVTDGISMYLTKGIYVLVGLSAIYEIVMHKSMCKLCAGGGSTPGAPM